MTEAKSMTDQQEHLMMPARTQAAGLLLAIFALLAMVAAGGAAERLVDYDPIEAVGTSWTYRMLNSQGQTVGDLSAEITEEEADGFFRSRMESNLGGMLGIATFRQRFNGAGERVVDKIEFENRFDEMAVESSSVDYGEPKENFSSLSYSVPGEPGEPGEPDNGFTGWVSGHDLPEGQDGPDANPSGDGISNAMKDLQCDEIRSRPRSGASCSGSAAAC